MQIDDTHYEIPAPDSRSETSPQFDPSEPLLGPTSRRPYRATLVLLALLAGAFVLAGSWAMSANDELASSADDVVELASPDTDVAVEDAPEATTPPTTEPVAEDPPAPAPDPAPDPQPEPEPEPVDPCDLLAPGQVLAITTGPVQLPIGTYAGELTITNCGDGPVAWSASTLAPSVTLGVAGGMLAGGAEVDLQFAVDKTAIVGSGMAFFITLTEGAFETDVMIQVTKAVINPGIILPNPQIILDQ